MCKDWVIQISIIFIIKKKVTQWPSVEDLKTILGHIVEEDKFKRKF